MTTSTPTVEAEGAESTIWIPGSKNKGLLTRSRTILVLRDPQNCITPWNYWPIISFQTTEESLRQTQQTNSVCSKDVSITEKGIGNDTRGPKHQLIVDKASGLKTRQTSVSTTHKHMDTRWPDIIRYGIHQGDSLLLFSTGLNHSNMAKVLWDFELQTSKQLLTNRPIVMVVDK